MTKKKSIKIIIVLSACAFILPCSVWAMDVDLWDTPKIASAQEIWKDKPVEINNINTQATHLRTSLKADAALDFYREYFLGAGWKLKDDFKEQKIIAFSRQGRLMYVVARDNGPNIPCDIYLVSSPADLALCRIISSNMQGGFMAQDSAGKDISDIPRYPTSKRMMNIFLPQGEAVMLYQTAAPVGDVASFYRRELKSNGWKVIQEFDPGWMRQAVARFGLDVVPDNAVFLFEKNNSSLVMHIMPLPATEQTTKSTLIIMSKDMQEEFASIPEIKEK